MNFRWKEAVWLALDDCGDHPDAQGVYLNVLKYKELTEFQKEVDNQKVIVSADPRADVAGHARHAEARVLCGGVIVDRVKSMRWKVDADTEVRREAQRAQRKTAVRAWTSTTPQAAIR